VHALAGVSGRVGCLLRELFGTANGLGMTLLRGCCRLSQRKLEKEGTSGVDEVRSSSLPLTTRSPV
jgi:hypothetical protein